MKMHLASSAELYREHRRTQSPKKKAKIAAELQRRHDQQNEYDGARWWFEDSFKGYSAARYDFTLLL